MNESPRAARAYNDYVDLGAARSLTVLVAKYQTNPEAAPTTNLTRLKVWSRVHRWQDRLRALEAKEAERSAVFWQDERKKYREHALDTGYQLLARAEQMLRFPLQTTTRTTDDAGHETVIIRPANWRMGDVATFVATADKLMRLALELETERVTLQDLNVAKREVQEQAIAMGLDPDAAVAEFERMMHEDRL